MAGSVRFLRLVAFAAVVVCAVLSGGCAWLFREHIRDLAFTNIEPMKYARSGTDPLLPLRLHFTTSRDLVAGSTYGSYVDVMLCSEHDKQIAATQLEYRGRALWDYRPAHSLPESATKPFEYTAVLHYDPNLMQDAPVQDMCFEVSGSGYMGMDGLDSNAAVIPKDVLARALAELRDASQ